MQARGLTAGVELESLLAGVELEACRTGPGPVVRGPGCRGQKTVLNVVSDRRCSVSGVPKGRSTEPVAW